MPLMLQGVNHVTEPRGLLRVSAVVPLMLQGAHHVTEPVGPFVMGFSKFHNSHSALGGLSGLGKFKAKGVASSWQIFCV